MSIGSYLWNGVKTIGGNALAGAGIGAAAGAAVPVADLTGIPEGAGAAGGFLAGAAKGAIQFLSSEALASVPEIVDGMRSGDTPEQVQAKLQPEMDAMTKSLVAKGISPSGAQQMVNEAYSSQLKEAAPPEYHPILDAALSLPLAVAGAKLGSKVGGKLFPTGAPQVPPGMQPKKPGQPIGNSANGTQGGGSTGTGSVSPAGTANAAQNSSPTTNRPDQPQPSKAVPGGTQQGISTALDVSGQDRSTAGDAGGRGTSAVNDSTGQPYRGSPAPTPTTTQGFQAIDEPVPAFPQRPNMADAGMHTQVGDPAMEELARQHGVDQNGLTQEMSPIHMDDDFATRTQPMNYNMNMMDTATHNATADLPTIPDPRTMQTQRIPNQRQLADTQLIGAFPQ